MSECLDIRCIQYVKRGHNIWTKGVAMVRKEWLTKNGYKEISGWRGIRDSMVDELVQGYQHLMMISF